ncbi:TetR/AcrR family transcriptional regulator [Paenibacillus sp. FJAT-26967]|uniref:TetR/AcrR family transcriptional regulator n=1 Tax=Paenibacillus sp. FJAT-26967 TaxID=1729690 RepID=UPI0008395FA3|nr:TetR/AcrR family transcriptional regulator [Paenibacillus sp. FJAT-26967]
MNGFERRREQKRQSICRAALKLYMRHGLRDVGIVAIAKAAGVSQVTIYNYFGSKEDLTRDVIANYLDQYLKEFEAFCQGELPYQEKLEQLLLRSSKFDSLHTQFIDTFLSDAPEMAEIVKTYEAKLIPLFVAFIGEGKRLGFFNSSLSTDTILFYINLFSSQALQRLREEQDENRKRQMYKELFVIFFNGVGERPLNIPLPL